MTCDVTVHHDPNFVEGVYRGAVTPEDLAVAVQCMHDAASDEGPPRFLTDLSGIELGPSREDIERLSGGVRFSAGAREAIVLPEGLSPRLLATVMAWARGNAQGGLVVRLFDHRTRAIDWLVSSEHNEHLPA